MLLKQGCTEKHGNIHITVRIRYTQDVSTPVHFHCTGIVQCFINVIICRLTVELNYCCCLSYINARVLVRGPNGRKEACKSLQRCAAIPVKLIPTPATKNLIHTQALFLALAVHHSYQLSTPVLKSCEVCRPTPESYQRVKIAPASQCDQWSPPRLTGATQKRQAQAALAFFLSLN